MNKVVRIGTRGSKLALFQAYKVKEDLENFFNSIQFEIIIIKTKGDKILDVPLANIGDKGLFTKELENALYSNEIDLAVHSLKDLPTTFPEGLQLGAVLERGEFRDCLVSSSPVKLSELTDKMVIATSSLRRKAQLLKINKNFKIIDIRGNVNTRIRKMEEGYCDVMVMASAGLQRLGLNNYISEIIDPNMLIPACSQGAIAVEIRQNDTKTQKLISQINHKETSITTSAERAFLKTLEGGCQIPLGSYSNINGTRFFMKGIVASIDGKKFIEDTIEGDIQNATQLAINLANQILKNGGKKILETLRDIEINTHRTNLPLKNKTIISTRPFSQHDNLKTGLRDLGATVLELPMIEILPSELTIQEKKAISNLSNYNWIFFTSRNGVKHFFKHLIDTNGNTELPQNTQIAVIGKNTVEELDYYGYKPDFINQGNTSEDLLNSFLKNKNPVNLNFLLALGNLASEYLEKKLSQNNKVFRVNVYKTKGADKINPSAWKPVNDNEYDLILFTSPSTFENFCRFYDLSKNQNLKAACIGTVTAKVLEKAGVTPLLISGKSNSHGFVASIKEFLINK